MGLFSEVSHRFAAGWPALGSTYTLFLFPVKCAAGAPSLPFLLSSHRGPRSRPVLLLLSCSLRLSFIHRKIWPRRPGFQAKNPLPAPPPTTTPPPTHTHPRFFILCPHQDLRSPRAESFYSRQKIQRSVRQSFKGGGWRSSCWRTLPLSWTLLDSQPTFLNTCARVCALISAPIQEVTERRSLLMGAVEKDMVWKATRMAQTCRTGRGGL